MMFSDQFSDHVRCYAEYRPTYPDDLFRYLQSLVRGHELAWDCATGNGQAAIQLAPYFQSVVAVDASPQQLSLAIPHEKIAYVVALANQIPLPSHCADLVTVASAIHWLAFPAFYAEVRRVSQPGGIFAVWGYKRPSVSPEIDAAVLRLDTEVLHDFWLPETRFAALGYRTLPFPFHEIDAPSFRMNHHWNLDHFMGFLGTWSASLRYRKQTGRDPIDEIRAELTAAWPDAQGEREVDWEMHLRVGRVGGD